MTDSGRYIQERAAHSAAANAGARAGVFAGATFDANGLARDLAARKHGIGLSLAERQLSEASEHHALLLAALNCRRAIFAKASARFAHGTDGVGNTAVLIFDHVSHQFTAAVKWIPAAIGVLAPVLRFHLRSVVARKTRLTAKRDELSVSVAHFAAEMERIFADFKRRAEALKSKN